LIVTYGRTYVVLRMQFCRFWIPLLFNLVESAL
jgi:hypothetical protein